MRKIIVGLLIVFFCATLNTAYAREFKLAYISMKEILDNYARVKDGEDALLKEAEEKNKERDKLVKEIKTLREKMDLLSETQKQKKQKELDEKLQALQDFTYESGTGLRKKRDEKLMAIMKEVRDVIEEYGKSRNYDMVIDDTLILYKDKSLNVTADIIKMLNQRYKK